MFFDPIYWLVVGAGLVLSLWASFKVKGTFAKYSQFATRSGMSGADVTTTAPASRRTTSPAISPNRGAPTTSVAVIP